MLWWKAPGKFYPWWFFIRAPSEHRGKHTHAGLQKQIKLKKTGSVIGNNVIFGKLNFLMPCNTWIFILSSYPTFSWKWFPISFRDLHGRKDQLTIDLQIIYPFTIAIKQSKVVHPCFISFPFLKDYSRGIPLNFKVNTIELYSLQNNTRTFSGTNFFSSVHENNQKPNMHFSNIKISNNFELCALSPHLRSNKSMKLSWIFRKYKGIEYSKTAQLVW